MLTVQAPAKINLTLEVLRKREDGFHQIRSVMQTVGLCDTFQFESADDISFHCDSAEWRPGDSLVSKAAGLLKESTGCEKGARIGVEKRIPMTAGLGGDSSDAAAVLRGLNALWELKLPPEKLRELGGRLGSDVCFFFERGTALAEGRGEMITPLPAFPAMTAVIVMPHIPGVQGKTGKLYGSLQAGHFTGGEIAARFVRMLKAGEKPDFSMLFNVFENVAFGIFPGLRPRPFSESGRILRSPGRLGPGSVHPDG
jgi:4-diphosphocytidyl-2-C-methyl-D-erythritol kinase